MDDIEKLNALIDLAEQLGVTIRRAPAAMDAGEHPGGASVRLRGAEILFLNPVAPVPDQMHVAVEALRGRPELEDRFLCPDLRTLFEEARQ